MKSFIFSILIYLQTLSTPVLADTPDYSLVNQYRKDHGYYQIYRSVPLEIGAYERAKDIYTGKSPWSHEGYQESIGKYYSYVHTGENLAKDFNDFKSVMWAWDRSPTHKNVLLERWCHMGIGNYKDVWVIHFATNWKCIARGKYAKVN